MKAALVLLALLVGGYAPAAYAQVPLPPLEARVTDLTGTLTAAQQSALDAAAVEQVQAQLTNDGLFGKVMHNVPANLNNLSSTGKTKIYGWFGTTAEISASIKVE